MSLVTDTPFPHVYRIRLDRPRCRNAVNADLLEALHDEFAGLRARAVVLGSTDPESFSAGADLELQAAERAALSDRLYELYEHMIALPVPVLAVVEGPAVGGGAQLAVAADVRIGGPDARFRFPGAGHGLAVGSWALPGLVGRGRALDYCLTMRWVDADEAVSGGLLTRLCADPMTEALAMAQAMTALDPEAVTRIKRLATESELRARLGQERRENARTWDGSVEGLA